MERGTSAEVGCERKTEIFERENPMWGSEGDRTTTNHFPSSTS